MANEVPSSPEVDQQDDHEHDEHDAVDARAAEVTAVVRLAMFHAARSVAAIRHKCGEDDALLAAAATAVDQVRALASTDPVAEEVASGLLRAVLRDRMAARVAPRAGKPLG